MGKAVGGTPLDAIRFFEVAARHQSFARAARDLGMTSGAVAHRVRTLEQYLGVELFERQSHGLALSVRGQAFLGEVKDTVAVLDETAERFRADAKAGALKLVAVEAFAEMWLMPRLDAFRSAHPEIVIEFETSLGDHHEVDPAGRAFDVWIAFVASVPRTVRSEVLFEETLVPVCSPGLLASWALTLGVSLPTIGRLLGHSEAQMTKRYAHLPEDCVRESAVRISDSIAADILPGYSGDQEGVLSVGHGRTEHDEDTIGSPVFPAPS